MREPEAIDKLARLLTRWPGIGPRQARRFIYYLLNQGETEMIALSAAIQALAGTTRQCRRCHRFFDGNRAQESECDICRDPSRDTAILMVVEKDADLAAVERAGDYHGRYFILGGLLPIWDKDSSVKARADELLVLAQQSANESLREIIIALAASSEGDNTIDYLKSVLTSALADSQVKVTILGRGLSTGSELEYADTNTLKNALKNRQ